MAMQDFAWKEAIRYFIKDFIKFFLPDLYDLIDFTQPIEFLDKELDEILLNSNVDRKVDQLVKFRYKAIGSLMLLVHAEIQGYNDHQKPDGYEDFADRMFRYFIRLYDRYHPKYRISSIAIITEGSSSFNPGSYVYPDPSGRYDKNVFIFDHYKIYDHSIEELEQSDNPFALVVLAARHAIENFKPGRKGRNETEEESKARKAKETANFREACKLELMGLIRERYGDDELTYTHLITFANRIFRIGNDQESMERDEKLFSNEIMDYYSNRKGVVDMSDFEVLTKTWFGEGMNKANLVQKLLARLNADELPDDIREGIGNLSPDTVEEIEEALPYVTSFDELRSFLSDPAAIDVELMHDRSKLMKHAARRFSMPALPTDAVEKLGVLDQNVIQNLHMALNYFIDFDDFVRSLDDPNAINLDVMNARYNLRKNLAEKLKGKRISKALNVKIDKLDKDALRKLDDALPYLRSLEEFKGCLAKPGALDLDALRARHDLRMDAAIKFNVPELGEAIEEKMRQMDTGSLQSARIALPYVSSLDEFAVCLNDPANPLFTCRQSLTYMLQRKLSLEKLPNDMAFLVNNADLVTIIDITSQIVAMDKIDKIKAVLGKY